MRFTKEKMGEGYFYKQNQTDKIWWYRDPKNKGWMRFSFDKKKVFFLFRDYPWELTKEQKEIFDKENPFWADYFSDRSAKYNDWRYRLLHKLSKLRNKSEM